MEKEIETKELKVIEEMKEKDVLPKIVEPSMKKIKSGEVKKCQMKKMKKK